MTAVAVGSVRLKSRERYVRRRIETLFEAERETAQDLAQALVQGSARQVGALRGRRRVIVEEIEALTAALPYLSAGS